MSDSSDKEEKSSFSDDEVVGTPNLSADELEKAGQALLFAGENNSTTQKKNHQNKLRKKRTLIAFWRGNIGHRPSVN